jgi:hypothetical protein
MHKKGKGEKLGAPSNSSFEKTPEVSVINSIVTMEILIIYPY